MSSLIHKHKKKYISRIVVRVGDRKDGKRKSIYVDLNATKYSYAKKRNAIVQLEENKIRTEIKRGQASKSDLLNINQLVDWEWLKSDGSTTTLKIHTLSEYADKFIKYQGIKQRRKSTIDAYRYSLKKFVDAIGGSILISDINDEHIDIYIEYLEKRNY